MRILVVFMICICSVIYFKTNATAMVLVNSEPTESKEYIFDIDLDCDYDPETDQVSNCKVVSSSDE